MSFSKPDLNFTEENHIDDSLMFNDTSSSKSYEKTSKDPYKYLLDSCFALTKITGNYELPKEKSWSLRENSIINIDPLSLDDVIMYQFFILDITYFRKLIFD